MNKHTSLLLALLLSASLFQSYEAAASHPTFETKVPSLTYTSDTEFQKYHELSIDKVTSEPVLMAQRGKKPPQKKGKLTKKQKTQLKAMKTSIRKDLKQARSQTKGSLKATSKAGRKYFNANKSYKKGQQKIDSLRAKLEVRKLNPKTNQADIVKGQAKINKEVARLENGPVGINYRKAQLDFSNAIERSKTNQLRIDRLNSQLSARKDLKTNLRAANLRQATLAKAKRLADRGALPRNPVRNPPTLALANQQAPIRNPGVGKSIPGYTIGPPARAVPNPNAPGYALPGAPARLPNKSIPGYTIGPPPRAVPNPNAPGYALPGAPARLPDNRSAAPGYTGGAALLLATTRNGYDRVPGAEKPIQNFSALPSHIFDNIKY